MPQYVFQLQAVGKIVPPKKQILRDISLSFFPGAKIGVLGLNGAGKSTLLKIMAGLDTEIEGSAIPLKGLKVGYLEQEPLLDGSKDVRGNIEEGLGEAIGLLERFNRVSLKLGEPMSDEEMEKLLEQQGSLQNQIDAIGGWEIERKLEIASDALRIPAWESKIAQLSGGERRRVALCRLLLSEPDMLLLDEPTNHLDAESVAWLERYLASYSGTVVAITHDRYFLDNIAGWILELDRGFGIPFEGNYSSWLEQKEVRLQQEEREQAAHKKNVRSELEWVRKNAKGRQSKSRARLQRFEELQSKEFQIRNETNEIYIPPGPRLGESVIQVESLSKKFDDKLLIDNLSFEVPPGAIVGVIGANGAGKTTLFKILTGEVKADTGNIKVGDTVKFTYVDQSRDSLKNENSVWEELSGGQDILKIGDCEIQSRAYCGRFNFKGQDQQKHIGSLSGGERNRVHLAKTLLSGANFIFLDEPTNDLDVETLRALEEAILNFPGCLMVVSHDRWFLDRVATHILAFEGDSHVEWFPGNYDDYAKDKQRRLGREADAAPKRIKYKPVVR